jgi:hypothetical protein
MNKWWQDARLTHALVEAARNLDEQYRDARLISLGHSPSWIVATVAIIRANEGREKHVAYVPFSGSYYKMDHRQGFREDRCPNDKAEDRLSFTADTKKFADETGIDQLFNSLCKKAIDPATILKSEQKAVIVDFAKMGVGFVSFMDIYNKIAKLQGLASDEQVLDAHLYKLLYVDGEEDISIELSDKSGTLDTHIRTQTGSYGYLANFLAGYSGYVARIENHSQSKEEAAARFMPYFNAISVCPESYYANHNIGLKKTTVAAATIRDAKKAVQQALQKDKQESAALAEEGFTYLKDSLPTMAFQKSWIAMPRGWH